MHYSVTESVCIECFSKMPIEEQHQMVEAICGSCGHVFWFMLE